MRGRRRRNQPFSLFSFQDIITAITGIIILLTLILTLDLITRRQSSPVAQSRPSAADLQASIARAQERISELQSQVDRETISLTETASMSDEELRRNLTDLEPQIERIENEISQLQEQEREAIEQLNQVQATSGMREADRARLVELGEKIKTTQDKLEDLKRQNRIIYNPSDSMTKQAWLVDLSEDRIVAAPVGRKSRPIEFRGALLSSVATKFLDWARERSKGSNYFVLLVRPSAIDTFDKVRSGLQSAGYDLGIDLISTSDTVVDPQHGAAFE